jgi:hypothetical protein
VSGRDPDRELDELFEADPHAQEQLRLLRTARLRTPPLDPAFKLALRRRLMAEAYERYERQARPGLLARIFTGPRFAFATAVTGLVLIAVIFLATGNLFGPGPVEVVESSHPVAVDQPISVSFNQQMDHKSVESAIQIEPATQVTYQWQGNTLLIQPVSGTLAPNTQYHVTIAPQAKAAAGATIGKTAVVAVNTTPVATPPPSPAPSPTASPVAAITSERNLAAAGAPLGWSADGLTLYYLAGSDLAQIQADGSGQKTLLGGGVTAAAVSSDGHRLLALQGGKVLELSLPAQGSPEVLSSLPGVNGLGWQGTTPIYWTGGPGAVTFFNATDQRQLGAIQGPVGSLYLSPDGSKLVYTPASAAPASPSPAAGPTAPGPVARLYDFSSGSEHPWAANLASNVAWEPGSTRVAFLAAGSVQVAQPDGTGAKAVLSLAAPTAEIAWTPANQLLVVTGSGTWLVKPDGSGSAQLRSSSVGTTPTWAPNAGRAALTRSGALWEVEIGTATSAALDLSTGDRVVAQYEKARINADAAAANALLTASGARTQPSPVTGDARLSRYFVISNQVTASDVRFNVRLIFAKGNNEVRYQDELLVLVASADSLKIDSVTDSPAHDLGKGPTVNSVGRVPGGVVLVFDSDLDPGTVAGSVSMLGPDGKPVALTPAYANRRLTITASLKTGADYQLQIASSLRDIDGQALQGGFQYQFVAE